MNTPGHPGAPNNRCARDGATHNDGGSIVDPAEQLGSELAERVAPFDQLAHASGTGHPFADVLAHLPTADLVAELTPQTASAILGAVWPGGAPADWWRTPLGRIVADQLSADSPAETITVAEAARMLGISHSRVVQLAETGHLHRSTEGIRLADVYRRLAHPGRSGRPGWRRPEPGAGPR